MSATTCEWEITATVPAGAFDRAAIMDVVECVRMAILASTGVEVSVVCTPVATAGAVAAFIQRMLVDSDPGPPASPPPESDA